MVRCIYVEISAEKMLYFASDAVLEPVLILSKTYSAVHVFHCCNVRQDTRACSSLAEVVSRIFSHCRAAAQIRLHMHIGL